ncbi:hypothetical protein AAFF_G00044410 [Aldrovandia affinis]|uniref:C2H2-type domain-containing protein n=1 Tax=Aldrovandia affinis TaxID=143900 RepID=A0AAD7S2F6_9TELE|nr:hypothetical protein AAFF_G00044410 [Aldrovandia affinis]
MASKRKSTTPCMVLPSDTVEQDPDIEVTEGEEGAESAAEAPLESATVPAENEPGGDGVWDVERYMKTMESRMVDGEYKCGHCSYQTLELNAFTFHVESEHPSVALHTSYVCVECNFLAKQYDALSEHNARHHPGWTVSGKPRRSTALGPAPSTPAPAAPSMGIQCSRRQENPRTRQSMASR